MLCNSVGRHPSRHVQSAILFHHLAMLQSHKFNRSSTMSTLDCQIKTFRNLNCFINNVYSTYPSAIIRKILLQLQFLIKHKLMLYIHSLLSGVLGGDWWSNYVRLCPRISRSCRKVLITIIMTKFEYLCVKTGWPKAITACRMRCSFEVITGTISLRDMKS